MSFDFKQLTIHDAAEALDALTRIERPEGDTEGDAINSPGVYKSLSKDHKDLVDSAEKVAGDYLRQSGQRALTELNKRGYKSSFNPDQYDPDRLVGHVTVGDWLLDVSDPSNEDAED